jgi:hypothetical protein
MINRYVFLAVSTAVLTFALSGCGGGASVDVGVVVPLPVPVPPPVPDFVVTALIDGAQIPNLGVYPGESQTISVVAGDAFELDTDGPVYWDFSAGGSADIAASPGSTVQYGGASLNETAVGDSHLVLAVSSSALPGSSIPITIYVTSKNDSSQVAAIEVLVAN